MAIGGVVGVAEAVGAGVTPGVPAGVADGVPDGEAVGVGVAVADGEAVGDGASAAWAGRAPSSSARLTAPALAQSRRAPGFTDDIDPSSPMTAQIGQSRVRFRCQVVILT